MRAEGQSAAAGHAAGRRGAPRSAGAHARAAARCAGSGGSQRCRPAEAGSPGSFPDNTSAVHEPGHARLACLHQSACTGGLNRGCILAQEQELQAVQAQTAALHMQQAGASFEPAVAAAAAHDGAEAPTVGTSRLPDMLCSAAAAAAAHAEPAAAGSADPLDLQHAHAEPAPACARVARPCSPLASQGASGRGGPAAACVEDTPDALEVDSSPVQDLPAAHPPASRTSAASTESTDVPVEQERSAARTDVQHARSGTACQSALLPLEGLGHGSAPQRASPVAGVDVAPAISHAESSDGNVTQAAEVQTGTDAAPSANAAASQAHDLFASFAAFQDLPADAGLQACSDKKRKRGAGAM